VELIVVLAIIGLAAALVTPSLFRAADKFTLNSAGRRFVATLRAARNEARSSQKELLATVSEGSLILANEGQERVALRLAEDVVVEAESTGQSDAGAPHYAFLPSGQILGPARLAMTIRDRYRGFVVLGPAPGAVRFEDAR
jgi:type II secretory pathway pseudopilin PulG